MDNEYNSVLTKFIEGVPKEKGWWYTVPTTESMQHKSTINDLFPHIGTLLGIPEYIVAYILFKIGVMKIRKDKVGVTTSPMMWNDFMRGNLLTINEMEITQVRIMKVRYTLMKIGAISESPNVLLTKFNKNKSNIRPPMITGTYRRSLKVIKSELFPLIRNEIIEDFNNQYFSSKPMDATKNTNNNSKFVDPEEENEEVAEVIVNDIPDTLTGNIPSEEEFPMMHHFKIPTDNKHCVNNLLVELLGNVEDSNKCFSVYKYDKEITYSRIPKGTSRKQLWLLNNNVKQTVSYGTETNNDNLQIRLNSSLSALKNTYEDQFEESLIEMGVVTS